MIPLWRSLANSLVCQDLEVKQDAGLRPMSSWGFQLDFGVYFDVSSSIIRLISYEMLTVWWVSRSLFSLVTEATKAP